MKIYNRLRKYRKQAGLTQRMLAEALQIHVNEISDIENQKRGPVRCVKRAEWEEVLRVPISDVFYFDD